MSGSIAISLPFSGTTFLVCPHACIILARTTKHGDAWQELVLFCVFSRSLSGLLVFPFTMLSICATGSVAYEREWDRSLASCFSTFACYCVAARMVGEFQVCGVGTVLGHVRR